MSKQSSTAKVDFILEMIENIEKIVKRHGGIVKAIDDFEGQMALLMGIAQIGETLKKFDDAVLTKHDLTKDKEGAYYTRNYIVHDYEGVDPAYVESIVRDYLPQLKSKLYQMQKDFNGTD